MLKFFIFLVVLATASACHKQSCHEKNDIHKIISQLTKGCNSPIVIVLPGGHCEEAYEDADDGLTTSKYDGDAPADDGWYGGDYDTTYAPDYEWNYSTTYPPRNYCRSQFEYPCNLMGFDDPAQISEEVKRVCPSWTPACKMADGMTEHTPSVCNSCITPPPAGK